MSNEISSLKSTIRSQMREALAHLTLSQVRECGSKVQANILCSNVFKQAESVAIYHPYQNEIETEVLFNESKKSGKQVAYPKMIQDQSALQFFWINSISELISTDLGFFEPNSKLSLQTAELLSIHLLVIPGLAFDRRGWRIGRGKGFYDRTLKEFKGTRLGVAYSFQVLEDIPHEEWDEPIHYLATENEWMKVS